MLCPPWQPAPVSASVPESVVRLFRVAARHACPPWRPCPLLSRHYALTASASAPAFVIPNPVAPSANEGEGSAFGLSARSLSCASAASKPFAEKCFQEAGALAPT